MVEAKIINTNTLINWLEKGEPISILDIRPLAERIEWYIPGSLHFNAYDKLKKNDPNSLDGLFLDKRIPVVVYCAGGAMSLYAAKILQAQGYDAFSLEGGMKGWSLAWNTAEITLPSFKVIQFRRTGKGCLSYMIISKNEAMVIDASINKEAYEKHLQRENAVLKYVTDTHIHADHLSRSRDLAVNNNARLLLPVPNKVNFRFEPITDAVDLNLGNVAVKAIHTPGHTLESTSYLIENSVLLTGDTLFINGVGRPDLNSDNHEAKQKLKFLYHSLQTLLNLNESILVLPAHTSNPIDFDNKPIQTTIGKVKKEIAVLQLNEEEFSKTILRHLPQTPTNYLAIIEKNNLGDFNDINPVDMEAGSNRCAVS